MWRNTQGNHQGALNFGNVEHLESMLEIIAIKLGREEKLQDPKYNALNNFLKGKDLPPLEEKFRKSPQRKIFDQMKEGAFRN